MDVLQFFSFYSGVQYWIPMAVLIVLAWTTFTLFGLVCLWAGLGRTHWFLRMAAAAGVVAAPLAVSAYELVAVFLFQFAGTALPLLAYRKLRRPSTLDVSPANTETALRRSQFTLRDMLLVTTLVAMLLAIATRIPAETWSRWSPMACIAGVASIATLLGAWIALGRQRWWLRLGVMCLVVVTIPLVVFLYCARAGGLLRGEAARSAWARRLAGGVVVLLSLLLLFPPGLAASLLVTVRPIPPSRPLSGTNGLETLIRLGKGLGDADTPDDWGDPVALALFVQQYRPTLDEVHAALKYPCQATLRYDMSDLLPPGLSESRSLARALLAQGMLTHLEKRDSEVVAAFSDIFRLSAGMQREGLAIHALVGWGCTQMGISGLAEIRGELNREQCRELVAFLRENQGQWDPLADIEARELAWQDHAEPWLLRALTGIADMLEPGLFDSGWQHAHGIHEARLRLLTAELALQWYRLEHGKNPATLEELAPKYLPTVPQDPFSGKALVYRPTPQGYLLYSIGPNGKDDGGKAPWYKDDCGDLLLDEPKDEEP